MSQGTGIPCTIPSPHYPALRPKRFRQVSGERRLTLWMLGSSLEKDSHFRRGWSEPPYFLIANGWLFLVEHISMDDTADAENRWVTVVAAPGYEEDVIDGIWPEEYPDDVVWLRQNVLQFNREHLLTGIKGPGPNELHLN